MTDICDRLLRNTGSDYSESLAMLEEGGQETGEKTLFESFIARIQNHPALALVLLVGATVIGIASFSDAVENLLGKTRTALGTDGALVMLVGDAQTTSIGFSLVASEASFEVTSIDIVPLLSVDLCRACSFLPRTDLVVEISSLAESADTITAAFDRLSAKTVRVFGEVGTVSIENEKSASFNLKVATAGERGAVFALRISVNNLVQAVRTDFVPEVLFGFVGPPDYAEPKISAVTFDNWVDEPDSFLRSEFARALGLLADERAENSLLLALNSDPDVWVRERAIIALGSYKSETSFAVLVATLQGEIGPSLDESTSYNNTTGPEILRRAAAKAFGVRGDKRASEFLVETWHNDTGFWVGNEAVVAYAKVLGADAFIELASLLENFDVGGQEDWQSRSSLIEAIAFTNSQLAPPLLIEQLSSSGDHWSRRAAAKGLANCKQTICVEALTDIAASGSDKWTREEAINSLVTLRAVDSIDELRAIASNPQDPVAAQAAKAVSTLSN